MSESEQSWSEEESAGPPRKKGIPGWLWFCGGGCLLALIAAIVLGVFAFRTVKQGLDPEVQWPKLQKTLPFDERPENLTLQWGSQLGFGIYTLFDQQDGYVAVLYDFPSAEQGDRGKIFSEEFKGGFMGIGEMKGRTVSTVEVQGRTLDVVRFYQEGGSSGGGPGQPDVRAGHSAFLDLTQEGATNFVLLFLISIEGDEEISDEEIRTFLEPFQVGPDR